MQLVSIQRTSVSMVDPTVKSRSLLNIMRIWRTSIMRSVYFALIFIETIVYNLIWKVPLTRKGHWKWHYVWMEWLFQWATHDYHWMLVQNECHHQTIHVFYRAIHDGIISIANELQSMIHNLLRYRLQSTRFWWITDHYRCTDVLPNNLNCFLMSRLLGTTNFGQTT